MPTPVLEKTHPRTEAALERLRKAMGDIEAEVLAHQAELLVAQLKQENALLRNRLNMA